jgi:hypothetical protein
MTNAAQNLQQPLVSRLTWRHLALPVALLAISILLAVIQILPLASTTINYHQLALGIAAIGAGFGWLAHSWRPGAGSQNDIIIPWLTVAALSIVGDVMGGSHMPSPTFFYKTALLALPFMIGLTYLTRLYAPTDLCSSSSAMGFCAGGATLAFMAFSTPLASLGHTLWLAAAVLGSVMLVSRITLCHFIKW